MPDFEHDFAEEREAPGIVAPILGILAGVLVLTDCLIAALRSL